MGRVGRLQLEGPYPRPLEEEMATHSSNSCLENPMAEEPGGLLVHGVTKSQT